MTAHGAQALLLAAALPFINLPAPLITSGLSRAWGWEVCPGIKLVYVWSALSEFPIL